MNKVFIIGGSSGIGLEMIKQIKCNSANIWNFSRSESYLADVNIELDLNEESSVGKFVELVSIEKPNLIIFNSGIGLFEGIGGNSKKVANIFNVNVIRYIQIIEKLQGFLFKGKVKVIFTSSTAAYINGANESIYNATKHALSAYIKSLQTELKYSNSETRVMEFVMHATNATNMTNTKSNKEEEKYLVGVIKEMFKALENGQEVFIPKYGNLYKKVFKNYFYDPIGQGISSIEYKKNKGVK